MPSSRTFANLPHLDAILPILAVVLMLLYWLPQLIPWSPDDRKKETVRHWEDSPQTTPLHSADLFRFRDLNRDNIVPPSDFEQATVILEQIENFWIELQEISKEENFRREDFAPSIRLDDWKRRLDSFHAARPDASVVGSDIHRLSEQLLAVGIDYVVNPLLSERDSIPEEWFIHYYLPVAREAVERQE